MIHYHGIAGAGSIFDNVKFTKGRHVFISFARPDVLPMVSDLCSSFALDNGAFTAWKQGIKFDWTGYQDFVETWRHHPAFDFSIIPDVIDGTEKENDALLDQWNFPKGVGIPVYHLHESLERLDRLIEQFGFIALGSSGDYATPGTKSWWRRIRQIMDVATDDRGRPRARIHGLRMLSPKIFSRLPLRSADSTNAERNGLFENRFGMYPSPTRGQRSVVIADIVESNQSAPVWNPTEPDPGPEPVQTFFDL
jgi:hypothetical protein